MELFYAAILLVIAIVAFRFYDKWQRIRRFEAQALAAAVQDSYSYLKTRVVEEAYVLREVKARRSAEAIFQHVVDTMIERAVNEDGMLLLGDRRPSLRQGIELEEEYDRVREAIKTEDDLKYVRKKIEPYAEAQLRIWHTAAEGTLPVVQPLDLRDRHTYVVGKSGSGKTTLLTWMMYQDAHDDQGFAFLSPEAETIEEDILPYLPESRLREVIYVNPADERNRFSFNPLHLDPGDDLDLKVEEVFTTLSRLIEDEGSARINQILRQALYALVELPQTTLLDIPRLLDRENGHYRKSVIAQLRDAQTKAFFRDTYETLPVNAHLPILTRLSQFIRPRRVRNVLCRAEQGLDFRQVMDEGKILLCNLSDGLLGEKTSQLLGGLIMSELQLAAISRADTRQGRRRRFFVYLDEFQSFVSHANVSYEKLLSRARKYKLPLILAHQQTGQLPPSLVREIFGNCSTIVSFLVSRDDAGRLAREFIRDDMPGTETVRPEELVMLDVGSCFAKLGRYAFPMEVTLTTRDMKKTPEARRRVLELSRRPREEAAVVPGEGERHEVAEPAAGPAAPADPFSDAFDPQELF